MTKWRLPAVLVALFAGLWLALLLLQRWVASEDFRTRVAAQVTAALGVPVALGGVALDVWPLPALALVDVRVLDHVIVAPGQALSMAERGLI